MLFQIIIAFENLLNKPVFILLVEYWQFQFRLLKWLSIVLYRADLNAHGSLSPNVNLCSANFNSDYFFFIVAALLKEI